MLAIRKAMPFRWSRGTAIRAVSSSDRWCFARTSADSTSLFHQRVGGSAGAEAGTAIDMAARIRR